MSEVDVQQPEIVTDVDQNRKYIEDFIDQIQSDNFAKAETNFKDMVGDKLATALDQQKAKRRDILRSIYSSYGMLLEYENKIV